MWIRVAFLPARFWLGAFVLGVLAVSTAIACGGVSSSKENGAVHTKPPPRRRAPLERARRRCGHNYFCAARSALAAFEAADKLTLVGCVQIASTMKFAAVVPLVLFTTANQVSGGPPIVDESQSELLT
jgi:hypothetical protein